MSRNNFTREKFLLDQTASHPKNLGNGNSGMAASH